MRLAPACTLVALGLLASAAGAATPPAGGAPDSARAREILTRVGQTYRGFESFHFRGAIHVVIEAQGQKQAVDMPFEVAMAKPGKTRTDVQNPMMRMLQVSDGDTSWTWIPQLGQYTQRMATPIDPSAGAAAAVGPLAAGTPLARYLAMTDQLVRGRLLAEEAVSFEGNPRDCWVVEAEYDRPERPDVTASPTRFWVEKQRALVLRESTFVNFENSPGGGPMRMGQVTTYDLARLDAKLPDSLFAFHAPQDARRVEELSLPGSEPPQSDLVGKPAVPFQLASLAGKSLGPASWKGKVVLLDFWATWCGPCRMEMPTIAKLDKELKAKGLVVVGVNVGESREKASAFLKKNGYAFTVLLDQDSEVSSRYGATGIPCVVVIDKQGNVSSHFIGVRTEDVLRDALAKAGLK